jgi:hypothetical protein
MPPEATKSAIGPIAATPAVAGDPAPRLRRATVVGIWAAWCVVIFGISVAVSVLPLSTRAGWGPELTRVAPPLARWDSGWYYGIARDGFRFDAAAHQNNVGFYPLYPLAMRGVHGVLAIPLFSAGILVSAGCLLGGLLFAAELAAEILGPEAAVPAVVALLFYPTSFYFLSVYTESLFLFTTALAFWSARRGLWLLAGIAGALASMTRFNGFLIALPIAWIAWTYAKGWKAVRWRCAIAPVLTLAGAAAFPVFLWLRFGDPFLYIRSTVAGWPQKPAPFWTLLAATVRAAPGHFAAGLSGRELGYWLELGTAILFTLLTIELFRKKLIPEGIYCLSTLLLMFSTGTLYGFARYALYLFPCFFLLGQLRSRPVLAFTYTLAGSSAGIVLMVRFVHWLFVD